MKLENRYTFQGTRQQVWDLLTDPKALQQCTPGCKELEEIGTDEFKASMQIGVGPVTGTFNGKIRMAEKDAPSVTSYSSRGRVRQVLFVARGC